jgi:hypothetical protein
MPVHGYALSEPHAHCDLPRNAWSTVPPATRAPAAPHRNHHLVSGFHSRASHHGGSWAVGSGFIAAWGVRIPRSVTMSSHRGADVSPRRMRDEITTPWLFPGQAAAHGDVGLARSRARAARSRRWIESPSASARPSRVLVAPHPPASLRRLGRPRSRRHLPYEHLTGPLKLPRRHAARSADRDSVVTDDRRGSVADRYLLLGENRQPCAAYEYKCRALYSTPYQQSSRNRS